MRERVPVRMPTWGRILERLCFLFPPVVGVGLVGVLREADPGVPYLERGLVLVGTFGYTLLTVAVAVVIVLDAREVRRTRQWRPRPLLYGLFALLWAPVVAVVYLTRRHRRFGTPPGWSGWWLVVALSLAASVLGIVAAAIGVVFSIPSLAGTGVGVASALAFGAFPVAIHQDAAYVGANARDWRPNPGLYLGVAFLSLAVAPLQPVVAAYYLSRRLRAVGPS